MGETTTILISLESGRRTPFAVDEQAQVLVQQTKQAEVTSHRPSQEKSKQPIMSYFPFLDEKKTFIQQDVHTNR
jgi:hypothetical protein